MKALIQAAKDFARNAHYGHVRKYTGEPYWVHTETVADIVSRYGGSWEQIAAAHLHDTLEDTETTFDELENLFGHDVATLVEELTDFYTKQAFPNMNRVARKLREAMRLGNISNRAKTIKVADLIDNTASIIEHDPEFAKVYLQEKASVLAVMSGANPSLLQVALKQIEKNP